MRPFLLTALITALLTSCAVQTTPANPETVPTGTLLTLKGTPSAATIHQMYPDAKILTQRSGPAGFTLITTTTQRLTTQQMNNPHIQSHGHEQADHQLSTQPHPNGIIYWFDGIIYWFDGIIYWFDGKANDKDGQDPNAEAWASINLTAEQRTRQDAGQGTVAVIDTGIDAQHPMFEHHLLSGHDYVDNDSTPHDEEEGNASGHGSAVAGIIRQIAPNAKILPLRVLDADGHGYASDVAQAISDAADQGATVINLSLGAAESSPAVNAAIQYAIQKGATVIGATGNQGLSTADHPAQEMRGLNGAISVGALKNNQKTAYSNGQAEALLPGTLVSAAPNGRYAQWTGTSMSAAVASGLAALGLSHDQLGDEQHDVTPTLP